MHQSVAHGEDGSAVPLEVDFGLPATRGPGSVSLCTPSERDGSHDITRLMLGNSDVTEALSRAVGLVEEAPDLEGAVLSLDVSEAVSESLRVWEGRRVSVHEQYSELHG